MQLGHAPFAYNWHDHWATLPETASAQENGRTHGICVTDAGHVVVFAQCHDGLLTYDPDGRLVSATGGDRWLGAHGLTRVVEDNTEYLWLADEKSAEVAKVTLDGQTVQTLEQPDHPIYHGDDAKKYVPTWVAVNPANGDIWVADGYGSSHVHRYNKDGDYQQTINGEAGGGKFACPHGIAFDTRGNKTPELYVADRGNHRVQVYDGEGRFKRFVGNHTLHSPCMFDFLDDLCLVPELFARVDVLDRDDNPVAMLGDHGPAVDVKGWPNHNRDDHPELIQPGRFNSPHGGCFAPNGDIYLAEWIIGGRITRLEKC